MTCDKERTIIDIWQVTYNVTSKMWRLARVMWKVTCDRWHEARVLQLITSKFFINVGFVFLSMKRPLLTQMIKIFEIITNDYYIAELCQFIFHRLDRNCSLWLLHFIQLSSIFLNNFWLPNITKCLWRVELHLTLLSVDCIPVEIPLGLIVATIILQITTH